jgi:hypothetical protein
MKCDYGPLSRILCYRSLVSFLKTFTEPYFVPHKRLMALDNALRVLSLPLQSNNKKAKPNLIEQDLKLAVTYMNDLSP